MKYRIILILTCGVFVLSGCTTTSDKDKGILNQDLLEPQAIMKFADIPVPAGFVFRPQDSYAFESSGVRVGLLKYKGKAKIEQVATFYKDQMPIYNWNLLNIVEYGDRLLNFDRDSESCIINLLPRGRNVLITITVGPKSQIPAKKSTTPIK